jgi:hypothetical protein
MQNEYSLRSDHLCPDHLHTRAGLPSGTGLLRARSGLLRR